MRHMMVCISMIAGLMTEVARAQFGVPWRHTPKITVVGPAGDSRLRAVRAGPGNLDRTISGVSA
jgi:hypothetical protein